MHYKYFFQYVYENSFQISLHKILKNKKNNIVKMFCHLSVILKIGNVGRRNFSGAKCEGGQNIQGRNVFSEKNSASEMGRDETSGKRNVFGGKLSNMQLKNLNMH